MVVHRVNSVLSLIGVVILNTKNGHLAFPGDEAACKKKI